MKNRRPNRDVLSSQLKRLVADIFRPDLLEPDSIADHASLVGGSLGLDAMDALELAICVEEEFGIAVCGRPDADRAFQTVASLAGFICASRRSGSARRRDFPAVQPVRALVLAAPA